MKTGFLISLIFIGSHALHAGKIDEDFLKKITGTKWDLVEEKKHGKIISGKKKSSKQETITFSEGTMLFDFPDQHYACDYKLKNRIEFWLYCSEPDQYIYSIHSLNNRKMVLDMLVKDRKGNYHKTTRMYFHIHP